MEKFNISDRKFKFWFYQISHSEAIIRSPKADLNKTYNTNIDIYLGDIKYIEIPWLFRGLMIESGKQEDVAYLSQKLGEEIPAEKIIVMISEGKRFYVVASIIRIMENELDYGVLPIYAFLSNYNEEMNK